MSETITILGASVRAAVQSACRAGFATYAADLFADLDLQRCCPAVRVVEYPEGLTALCAADQPGPWMYTGALENHPGLVQRLSRLRPLLGNDDEALRQVRDPFVVAAALRRAGLACPQVRRDSADLPDDGSWLRKPLHSAGGARIRPWIDRPTAAGGDARRPGDYHYFQQRIDGTPCAALYVTAAGRAVLLGVTEQLIGTAWTGATGYRYAGSMGPLTLDAQARAEFEQIGQILASEFGLSGLLGVDAILADGRPWPVEINPRYTASVEVVERALGLHCVRLHVDACRGQLPNRAAPTGERCCGKAIVFARRELVVPAGLLAPTAVDFPGLADIPHPGATISGGRPVVTVLVEGADGGAVLIEMQGRVAEIEQRLYV